MERKIILDRNQSKLLLAAAALQTDSKFLNKGLNDTLFSMVLFEGAELALENLETQAEAIERLRIEGIAQPVPRKSFLKPARLVDEYLGNITDSYHDSEHRVTALAQEKSFQAIWPLISSNSTSLKHLSLDQAILQLRHWGEVFGTDSGFHDLNFGYMYNEADVNQRYGLPRPFDYQMHSDHLHLASGNDRNEWEDDSERVSYLNELEGLNLSVPEILARYVEMRGLTLRSSETGFPIITNFGEQRYSIDRSLGEEALQLCRIHLNEVRWMPYLENLDDVLRLRNHQYINHFREAIFEWLSRVSAGEANVEAKYRAQIKLASEEFKKLEKWKMLDSPYTLAVSMAVGAVEIFTGTPFGMLFSLASGAAMVKKRNAKRKYGYALFKAT